MSLSDSSDLFAIENRFGAAHALSERGLDVKEALALSARDLAGPELSGDTADVTASDALGL